MRQTNSNNSNSIHFFLSPGLLEPVLPGSAIFDDSILPPLYNSYLYEESRKSFIYSSAHLINNDILQKRVSTLDSI